MTWIERTWSSTRPLRLRLRRLNGLLGLIMLGGAFPTSPLGTPPVNGQDGTQVFLPAPRELRQEFDRAQADIAEENYVDAIARLDLILNGSDQQPVTDFGEDYFVLPIPNENEVETERPRNPLMNRNRQLGFVMKDDDAPLRSLKSAALELLGSLPEQGQQAYELQHGQDARQALEQALAARDVQQLESTARRYFHTQAGYDATMLLGRWLLSRQDGASASIHFQRLQASDRAVSRFGMELPVVHACALLVAGRPDEAGRVLDQGKKTFPAGSLELRGTSTPWFADGESSIEWLTRHLGKIVPFSSLPQPQWMVFGGNPQRSGIAEVSMPLRRVHWEIDLANVRDRETIKTLARVNHRSLAITPAMHPLVVKNTILMRTIDRLMAVDLKTGLRTWIYPWSDEGTDENSRSVDSFGANQMHDQFLQQRIWEDSVYGQISSDGNAVYLLERDSIGNPNIDMTGIGTNRLRALELASEGKSLWGVGGQDGMDEPRLAGIFFLGPPLPVGPSLYVLGEISGEIRLIVLDKNNGHLQWSQQLAGVTPIGTYGPFGQGPNQRRLLGVNPCLQGSILVCPTSAGGVVGVDIAQRTLLWGFRYQNVIPRSQNRPSVGRWRDNAVLVHNDSVICTPLDSDSIYVLDLLTGKVRWKQARGSGSYVAGVALDHVVVVGDRETVGRTLANGNVGWKVEFPAPPSGRGLMSSQHFYIGTDQSELLQIDLKTGKISDRRTLPTPIGNLIACNDQLITQDATHLRAFYQWAGLQRQVTDRLQQNPQDAEALEYQGLLMLDRGEWSEGLRSLSEAVTAYGEEQPIMAMATRALLVDTMLTMLRDNHPESTELATRIEPLIDDQDQRLEFQRLVTTGLLRAGKIRQAFAANLKLLPLTKPKDTLLTLEDDQLMEADRHRRIRPDRWHRSQFEQMWSRATESDRNVIAEQVIDLLQRSGPNSIGQLLEVFGNIPTAHSRLLDQLSESISHEVSLAPLEMYLLWLIDNSTDSQIVARSLNLLGDVYRKAGKYGLAVETYEKLRTSKSSVRVENKSASELATDRLQLPELVAHVRRQQPWPFGAVEVNADTAYDGNPNLDLLPQNVPGGFNNFRRGGYGGYGSAPGVVTDIEVEQLKGLSEFTFLLNNVGIEAVDRLGQVQLYIPPPQLSMAAPHLPTIKSYGHTIVTARGDALLAVDGLPTSAQLAGQSQQLWSIPGQSPISAAGGNPNPRGGQTSELPLTLERRNPLQPMASAVATVSAHGIVYRNWGNLICLDPTDGEVIWRRDDVPPESYVWGDADFVFTHHQGDRLARVFRTLDGMEQEQRIVPDAENRIREYGQYVLNYRADLLDDNTEGVRIQLNDLFKSYVWYRTYSSHSLATFVSQDKLAIFDPQKHRFQILSVLTGNPIVDHEIHVENHPITSLSVHPVQDYFVATFRKDGTSRDNDRKVPMEIEVYAFHMSDGTAAWSVPAKLTGFREAKTFADQLPIAVFRREAVSDGESQTRQDGGQGGNLIETVVLDVRDGRIILRTEGPAGGATLRVRGDIETHQIHIDAGTTANRLWTLTFTDKPRPPSPPDGYGTAIVSDSSNGPLGVIQAMIKALGKGLPSQEIDLESDEDLFDPEEEEDGE